MRTECEFYTYSADPTYNISSLTGMSVYYKPQADRLGLVRMSRMSAVDGVYTYVGTTQYLCGSGTEECPTDRPLTFNVYPKDVPAGYSYLTESPYTVTFRWFDQDPVQLATGSIGTVNKGGTFWSYGLMLFDADGRDFNEVYVNFDIDGVYAARLGCTPSEANAVDGLTETSLKALAASLTDTQAGCVSYHDVDRDMWGFVAIVPNIGYNDFIPVGNTSVTITTQFYIGYAYTSKILNTIQTNYIATGGEWYDALDQFMASLAERPGMLFDNIIGKDVQIETKLIYILFFSLLMMFIVVIFKR